MESVVFISYADHLYKGAQLQNAFSYKKKKIKVINYGPEDLDRQFYEQHKHILQLKRGAGYWLWKPYIILKTLLETNYKYIIYCDSGSKLADSIEKVIKRLKKG